MMSDLLADLRVSVRSWQRRPGVAATVIVTLALGLGGAIGVFSVAYAVLWRPLACWPRRRDDLRIRLRRADGIVHRRSLVAGSSRHSG